MFTRHSTAGYHTVAPGVEMRSLCHGARTHIVEFRLAAGHELPAHSHPHEQTGYLVSGRIRLRIGGDARDLDPGDSWSVPGGVEHAATSLEDSVAVEVFSPVREEFLAMGT